MSRQPDPIPGLLKRIEALEDEARRKRNSSPFTGTGMAPNGLGGVQSTAFDGDLAAGSAGTKGWAMNDTRAAFGELILRPGSVGNDSLTEPVRPARLHSDAQNFAVGTAWATVASVSITVPAGYTQALIMTCATGATAYNNTSSVDFLYTRTRLNGAGLSGWTIGSVDITASGTGVAYDFSSGLITGLTPGSTQTFSSQVSSAFGSWSASASNVANLDVALLWLR